MSIDLPCIKQYNVLECISSSETIEQALASENEWPLQQFFLIPHRWTYLVQQRKKSDGPRSWTASIYRCYWWLGLDILFHLFVLLFAVVCRSRMLVRLLHRFLLPTFVIRNWKVVDRSDKMLTMEHETFRHLELEAFVKKERVIEASRLVEIVLKQADGSLNEELDEQLLTSFEQQGLMDDFRQLEKTFTHHYPICFRRILRDDTMISMASGDSECWYSISFITYVKNREAFYEVATFLAKSLHLLYEGRIHWGKWFPLKTPEIEQMYPELDKFRETCKSFDPEGVFQNQFTQMIRQTSTNK